jgi:hypothetical protein
VDSLGQAAGVESGRADAIEARKQRAREILAASEDRLTSRIAELFTAGARLWVPPSATARASLARPIVGTAAIASVLTSEHAFEKLHWHILECVGERDYVVIHTRMNSRTKAGKDYDATHLWLFRFEGDLVAEAWEYADTAYAFERMGV